ncbi:hypothetical protein U1Q18_005356, partial [Sarracenia purpurea var. burkii]
RGAEGRANLCESWPEAEEIERNMYGGDDGARRSVETEEDDKVVEKAAELPPQCYGDQTIPPGDW